MPLDPQRALDLFVNDMTSWWPPEHHIEETPLEEIVVEPFVELEHRDPEAYGEAAAQRTQGHL